MKKLVFSFGILGLWLLSSCVSINKGFQSSPVVTRNVQLDPIKADIKVDEKNMLKGESSSSYILMFRIKGDHTFADGISYTVGSRQVRDRSSLFSAKRRRISKTRSAAAYNALKGKDFDFIVHPKYTITAKNYVVFKKYLVQVEGYGAKYTNFRTEKQKVVILDGGKEYVFPDNE